MCSIPRDEETEILFQFASGIFPQMTHLKFILKGYFFKFESTSCVSKGTPTLVWNAEITGRGTAVSLLLGSVIF